MIFYSSTKYIDLESKKMVQLTAFKKKKIVNTSKITLIVFAL